MNNWKEKLIENEITASAALSGCGTRCVDLGRRFRRRRLPGFRGGGRFGREGVSIIEGGREGRGRRGEQGGKWWCGGGCRRDFILEAHAFADAAAGFALERAGARTQRWQNGEWRVFRPVLVAAVTRRALWTAALLSVIALKDKRKKYIQKSNLRGTFLKQKCSKK